VQPRGAHKDGLSGNTGSILDIAGSRIRHDGSKDSVALLRLAKELRQGLAQWTGMAQKRRLLGQRTSCLKCNRLALSKSEIDGCRRCACLTISLGAGCSNGVLEPGCRWYTATTTVLMRGLYRVSEGQTSGNGGRYRAPVSAKSPKNIEMGIRTDVSRIAGRLVLGMNSEVRRSRVVRATIEQLAIDRRRRFQSADIQPFN
jgi:hypothetical protein